MCRRHDHHAIQPPPTALPHPLHPSRSTRTRPIATRITPTHDPRSPATQPRRATQPPRHARSPRRACQPTTSTRSLATSSMPTNHPDTPARHASQPANHLDPPRSHVRRDLGHPDWHDRGVTLSNQAPGGACRIASDSPKYVGLARSLQCERGRAARTTCVRRSGDRAPDLDLGSADRSPADPSSAGCASRARPLRLRA
jgi:hypothetical protein